MARTLLLLLLRRAAAAMLLVLIVSSAALVLARLAPGDQLATFDRTPEQIAAERTRLGLDAPLHAQYLAWLRGVLQLDFGESTRYPGRSIAALIAARAGNSALLGAAALVLATVLGIPLGILTGSRSGTAIATIRGATAVLLSIPPVVLSLALLLVASRTGWFPVGGLPDERTAAETLRYLVLPVTALALPIAAALERLQARSIADALAHPAIVAARARGLPARRIIWRHAFRLSLTPVLAVYGIIVGALISGSFIVEYVMTWPGLGRLMYEALQSRDAHLVAACAATGATFLASGLAIADIGLALVDPRSGGMP